MATDGSIVIGTELSTDKFDKQASELDNKIKKEEQKKIIIEAKMQLQEQDLEEAIRKTDELAEAYQNLKSLKEKATAGKMTPGDFEAMQSLQNQYGTLEKIDGLFQKSLSKQDALQLKVQETKNKYESINNEIDKYKQKLAGVNIQKQKAQVDQLKGSIDKVGSSFSGAVKKAGKLALAIFGIRGAYMLLKRASSELSGYDEQYATNLEYIRYVLTQAIAPVLKFIVNLAMQLLSWINAILQAWFGINLFANGSVESFQKMKKGAGGVSKAVKEIKKQLLGFDEVNMLTDQSDTGTNAGAGGVGAVPEMDLSAWQGKTPDWLQWIIDHKDEILAILAGIATGLTLIKFGMSGIKALGFGLIITGIVLAVQGLLDYLKNPTWQNFGKIIQGVGLAIIGLGTIIGSLPVAVIGAAVLIHGTIMKNWDNIKEKLEGAADWFHGKTEELQGWLDTKLNWLPEKFGSVGKVIKETIKIAVTTITTFIEELFRTIIDIFDRIYTGIRQVVDGIIKIFKGDFKGGIEEVGKGVLRIFTGIWEGTYAGFVTVWHTILKLFKNGGQIFSGFKEGILNTLKNLLNIIIRGINTAIAKPLDKINGVLNKIKGIEILGAKPFDGFYNWNPIPVPQIPQLKSGGIINMPNKGTLLGGGNALGGEAGKEGVIPLTDQQAMSELGREIGKNVLVNLTNIMQMNGRVISREMKQVTNTRDFAYNT